MNSKTPEEKFNLLFTLPKSTILITVFYFIILSIIAFLSLKNKILDWKTTLAFFGLNTLQIYLLKYAGGASVPYSTFRRIISAEIVASFLLLLTLPIYILFLKKFYLYTIIAFVTAFRFTVHYGAFIRRKTKALSIALLPILPFLLLIREF